MNPPMKRHIALAMMVVYTLGLLGATRGYAQSGCAFDKSNPSIDNARTSFQVFDFECAEEELQAVLKQKPLSVKDKADAHMLLAAVYYEMFQGQSEQRSKILSQFKEAFKSFRDWRGALDIQSPEFRSLMEEARAAIEVDEKQTEPVISREPVSSDGDKKGGSSKWLLIGLGAVVVVGGVALAAGGGGDDGGGGGTALPNYPDHPTR